MQMGSAMTELQSIIQRYLEKFPGEKHRLTLLIQQLAVDDGQNFHRLTMPGHITASGIATERDKILVIFHPTINKWLQPGGHVDPKEIPADTAIRETAEETGYSTSLHNWHDRHLHPIDIDIHYIAANDKKNEPAHLHYDFRHLLCATPRIEILRKTSRSLGMISLKLKSPICRY